jgi:hypothetical protein
MTKLQLNFLSHLIEKTDTQEGIFFISEDRDYQTVRDFAGANSDDLIKKGVYVYDTQINTVSFLDYYIPTKIYELDERFWDDGKLYYFDMENIKEVTGVV